MKNNSKKPGRERKEPQKQAKKAGPSFRSGALSLFVISMLLFASLANASYVAAWPGEGLWDSAKNTFSSVKDWVGDHLDEGLSLAGLGAGAWVGWSSMMAGAEAGSMIGSIVPGAGTLAGAVLGAIFGGLVGAVGGKFAGDEIQKALGINDDKKKSSGGTYHPGKIPNNGELEGNDTKELLMAQLREQLGEEVYKDMQDMMDYLSATMIQYDRQASGSIGYFDKIEIEGPSTIYGFSAFPVKLYLHVPKNKDLPSPVWVDTVCLWIEDNESNQYYNWCYHKPIKLEGSGETYVTILKAPDPVDAEIRQILANGFATRDQINKIFSAVPRKFEIKGYISGKAEIWKKDNGKLKFVENKTYNVTFSSLSAWKHISSHPAIQILPGANASLPLQFRGDKGWVPYATRTAGAVSNLIFRAWAQPVHVENSGADWKFYVIQNPEYPLNGVNITDDYRLEAYRIVASGKLETAYKLTGSLGSMTKLWSQESQIYYTATNDTVGFRVLYIVRGTINRGDIKIPVWLVSEPMVTVLENTEVVTNDKATNEIIQMTKDGKLSKEDAQQIHSLAATLIQGLQQKLDKTNMWLTKAQQLHKKEAVDYGKKAIHSYQQAINYAEKLKSVKASITPMTPAATTKLSKTTKCRAIITITQ